MNKIFFLCAVIFSFSASASTIEFHCESADGSFVLTQNRLQAQLSEDEILDLSNMYQRSPGKNVVVELLQTTGKSKKVGYLKINSIVDRIIVDKKEAILCPNGYMGPSFLSEIFSLKGRLHIAQQEPISVELSCKKQSYFSGHCSL